MPKAENWQWQRELRLEAEARIISALLDGKRHNFTDIRNETKMNSLLLTKRLKGMTAKRILTREATNLDASGSPGYYNVYYKLSTIYLEAAQFIQQVDNLFEKATSDFNLSKDPHLYFSAMNKAVNEGLLETVKIAKEAKKRDWAAEEDYVDFAYTNLALMVIFPFENFAWQFLRLMQKPEGYMLDEKSSVKQRQMQRGQKLEVEAKIRVALMDGKEHTFRDLRRKTGIGSKALIGQLRDLEKRGVAGRRETKTRSAFTARSNPVYYRINEVNHAQFEQIKYLNNITKLAACVASRSISKNKDAEKYFAIVNEAIAEGLLATVGAIREAEKSEGASADIAYTMLEVLAMVPYKKFAKQFLRTILDIEAGLEFV